MWCRYWPISRQHGDVMLSMSHGKIAMKHLYYFTKIAYINNIIMPMDEYHRTISNFPGRPTVSLVRFGGSLRLKLHARGLIIGARGGTWAIVTQWKVLEFCRATTTFEFAFGRNLCLDAGSNEWKQPYSLGNCSADARVFTPRSKYSRKWVVWIAYYNYNSCWAS